MKKDLSKSELNFKTTAEINVSKNIIDQVIGQEAAIEVVKKASIQRRHVLLIGDPGTGKSMLGLALAELLPKEKLVDVLSFPNPNDPNQPTIRTVVGGKGRSIVSTTKVQSSQSSKSQNNMIFIIIGILFLANIFSFNYFINEYGAVAGSIFIVGTSIISVVVIGLFIISLNLGKRMPFNEKSVVQSPRVIVDNFGKKQAPFLDATGAHAGALLGDVLHDPFQSGGLGTPAHERVVAGMIHKAHMGVLFIDEIATLAPATQQELLTAIQEGKFAITGQSERSAGAMVRTDPVPCKFVLIAAGNLDTIKHMHPALRSRIRGYGYEVYMKDTMVDSVENRNKLGIFVAQEVVRDGKIPHFSKDAVLEIIEEAKRKANRKGHLTLRLRELGGLIRAAGDIALEKKDSLVTLEHIDAARTVSRSLEKQLADNYIERKKEYEIIVSEGTRVGRVNGLAVIGADGSNSGILLPIESEVAPGKEKDIIATGKLGEIAKEAIKNVSAIIKKYFGEDIRDTYDIHVQFLQTYEGVEGDSASVAVAVAVISALKDLPIKQEYAMTGSLSVRGDVLPVGGVTSKVEAAIEAGMKKVIVPRTNLQDIVLKKDILKNIEIIPVSRLFEVLEEVFDWTGKDSLRKKINSNK
ncbi:ATP-dependent protease LonB [Candidatus Woesearchaeota archaeon]|nr:ATP-dependent protease LonB [Candidatus Woesearchaeota archaeon]MCF7901705.1 ATP-dependent protease LonB [Candidatus Woesearchaeota archaeon]MCF8014017.1 ATP-dependent protease LonB [Candidatus Woesearchaeota archaeon]